jgi:hypothetical protein
MPDAGNETIGTNSEIKKEGIKWCIMTELTTKSRVTYLTPPKTILVILVFFLVIIGITEAQISSEVKISNGENGENYSSKSYNWSWNWTSSEYINQTAPKGVIAADYVVVGGGGGGGSIINIYNNAAENASPVVAPTLTSQVVETPSDALANVNKEITDTFGAMATMMRIMLVGMVVVTIIYMVRWVRTPHNSNADEETPSHSSTPPQTVASNTPHYYPIPDTPPVKYEPPKPKKPVDRDGVEDDDSSFIEVLD